MHDYTIPPAVWDAFHIASLATLVLIDNLKSSCHTAYVTQTLYVIGSGKTCHVRESHLVIFREIPFQNIQLNKQPFAHSWLSYEHSNLIVNLVNGRWLAFETFFLVRTNFRPVE